MAIKAFFFLRKGGAKGTNYSHVVITVHRSSYIADPKADRWLESGIECEKGRLGICT